MLVALYSPRVDLEIDLAVAAGRAALEAIDPDEIDQVIVGNVLGAGLGMNVARQIGLGLGIPVGRPAYTVNMMCASGMQAVILASQAVVAGEARVVLCGGTESMSNAPFLLDRARSGYRLGDGVLIDSRGRRRRKTGMARAVTSANRKRTLQ